MKNLLIRNKRVDEQLKSPNLDREIISGVQFQHFRQSVITVK